MHIRDTSSDRRWLTIISIAVAVVTVVISFVLRLEPPVDDIPFPFRVSFGLQGAITPVGRKGGKSVKRITFALDQTKESLPQDTISIVMLTGANISDGAPLSAALTQGKRVFGYKYTSSNAAEERAAQALADASIPQSFPALFPGRFFASTEARADVDFIADFADKGIIFDSLEDVTLENNARYVFLALDAGTELKVRGLSWCGIFASGTEYAANYPDSVAIADFNEDGRNDMVTVALGDNGASVFLQNSDGTFTDKSDYFVGGYFPGSVTKPYTPDDDGNPSWKVIGDIKTGDLNMDGHVDIVISNPGRDRVSVLLGSGDGTFASKADYDLGSGEYPRSVAIGDFNKDTFPDLVIANYNNDSFSVLFGLGDGTFDIDAMDEYPTNRGRTFSVTTGDFNNDSNMDIITADHHVGAVVTIFLGNDLGGFTLSTDFFGMGIWHLIATSVADLNNDGKSDLAVANAGALATMLGNGDSTFNQTEIHPVGDDFVGAFGIADLDGDGILDMAVTNNYLGTVIVMTGKGDGTFPSSRSYPVVGNPGAIAIADLDSDTDMDIVMTYTQGNKVYALKNNCVTGN